MSCKLDAGSSNSYSFTGPNVHSTSIYLGKFYTVILFCGSLNILVDVRNQYASAMKLKMYILPSLKLNYKTLVANNKNEKRSTLSGQFQNPVENRRNWKKSITL